MLAVPINLVNIEMVYTGMPLLSEHRNGNIKKCNFKVVCNPKWFLVHK